ncbi:hypothetical protein [Corynebacterium marinum]|uniref:Primosomal protein n=1 Tax=Corynebacterium marinum DSM 44953 TaxID=1224162 RepID=A0A0B6TPD7_9CORY|nr:hypothetical protein [Corynebacterium marinum]AJK68124.1 hypothetical protein B840_02480 [Corynebacterium marinum DSM 44953]GGO10666.1 hypothetical protein GCM10010980_01190 [Corynebacterium marinum]
MTSRAIIPVKLSLTEGDYYTLWAPTWKEHGAEWQAFLGDDAGLFLFTSPARLLAFLNSGRKHDLRSHPKWSSFEAQPADLIVPDKKDVYDIVGAPELLAGRPSYENVSALSRIFHLTRSLGEVTGADDAVLFFASHSMLGNVHRGAEHYAGEHGMGEWSAVGRTVLGGWRKVVESLDAQVRVIDVDEKETAEAQSLIDAAHIAAAEARAKAELAAKEAEKQADPYDSSVWGAAGIDPVKITLQGKSVYTLRTYVEGRPVFLGRYGEIFTFPTHRQLSRWLVENDEHDMAPLATWEQVMTLANAGELDITVHPDNEYSYQGLVADIEKGPDAVDTAQMSRGYELFADAADWAADDSLNSYLLANPRMQDYLSYMLGSTENAGYVPSAPFNDHSTAWKDLEDMLIKRFSKF